MGEVVLVNKQNIIRFTTIVHNLATLPGQITSRNRNLLANVTKNLAINRFFVNFSKTLSEAYSKPTTNCAF